MVTAPLSLDQLGDDFVSGIVYGGTGVGKTILTCTSQCFRTFHFDVDNGAMSVKAFINYNKLDPRFYRNWPVTDMASFNQGFAWLAAHVNEFDLVVLDTASELHRICLAEICKRQNKIIPAQADWGVVLNQMEGFITNFRWLKLHYVWLAHEMVNIDEQTKRPMWQPFFKGAFSVEYAKHFSWIARYLLIEQEAKDPTTGQISAVTYRFLNSHRDQFTHGKDRSMALAKYEQPHLDAIFAKMMASTAFQGGR